MADTNPTAREQMVATLIEAGMSAGIAEAMTEQALRTHRTEVLAEAADDLRRATLLADDCACESIIRSQAAGGAR
ncbi:hypothetical protein [Streptomyces sp. NPDC059538]|uniref:hypothetical protein n=1 Tax=Streptomyces sp. NPDC059538 TaxID=3346860 RepID=UPI003677261B